MLPVPLGTAGVHEYVHHKICIQFLHGPLKQAHILRTARFPELSGDDGAVGRLCALFLTPGLKRTSQDIAQRFYIMSCHPLVLTVKSLVRLQDPARDHIGAVLLYIIVQNPVCKI